MNTSAARAMADFADFARMFPEKLFVNVIAYADESGTHDPTGKLKGSAVAGVAGYVGWCDDWKEFCGEWQTALGEYGVEVFHFSEFADLINSSKEKGWPYYGWDREKRTAFLVRLGSIANKWTGNGFCIGGFFRVDDYHRIIPSWFQEMEKPYGLCFKLFYEAMLTQINKQWMASDTQVAVMFDDNPKEQEWARLALKWYRITKYRADPDNRIGTIAFTDTRKCKPLQAADMIVYFLRQQLSNYQVGKPVSKNSFAKSLGRNANNTHIMLASPNYMERVAAELERRKNDLLEAHAEEENAQRENPV